MVPPAVLGCIRECRRERAGAYPRSGSYDAAPEPEASTDLLEIREELLEGRDRGDAHHASTGVAPQRGRIRSHDLEAFGGGQIDEVERGAAVRLGLWNPVEKSAHAARCAGVGSVAGATGTKPTNRESNVAAARARLRYDSGNILERFV